MNGEINVPLLIFAMFIIPMSIEAIVFARLNEWTTRIGIRTVRFRGHLVEKTQVDLALLQDIGFFVKAFSDGRVLLKPLTVKVERAREGSWMSIPLPETTDHLAVLTLGETHWTLEVFMPWLFYAFLLVMFGYLNVFIPPGGIFGGLFIGAFLVLVALVLLSYRSSRRAYRKVVEVIEGGSQTG